MADKNVNGYEYVTKSSGTVTAKGYLQDKAALRNGISHFIKIDFVKCEEFEKTYTIFAD